MVHHQRDPRLLRRFAQPFRQTGGQVGQGGVNARLGHFGQTGVARRHGDRVAGQGPRLVNRAGRRQRFHDFTASAERAHRHTAADDFAETSQIRLHAVIRLRARQRHAEAGHHFINNQQRAEFIAQRTQARQEVRLRRNAVHVAGNRLHDDAGDVLRILLKRLAHRSEIVVGAGQGVFGEVRRDARRVRLAEGQRAGTGFH